MQERDIFDERQETKKASFSCPFCRERNEYDVRWLTRTSVTPNTVSFAGLAVAAKDAVEEFQRLARAAGLAAGLAVAGGVPAVAQDISPRTG